MPEPKKELKAFDGIKFENNPDTRRERLESTAQNIIEMSRLMGKPTICIGVNKDADQLHGNGEADQRFCFRYSDSTIPLLLKSCACTGRFVSDLFGNHIVGFPMRRLK